jgi:hypothetical protein
MMNNELPVLSSNEIIKPPTPPTSLPNTPCTFDYLLEINRAFIKDAYDVISRNEWWDAFRDALLSRGVDTNTGFMFNSDPLYTKIMEAIGSTETGGGHSGCSMGFVMRAMQFIALKGEPAYREHVIQLRELVPLPSGLRHCVSII